MVLLPVIMGIFGRIEIVRLLNAELINEAVYDKLLSLFSGFLFSTFFLLSTIQGIVLH
jgi:hypothetical protein